MEHIDGQDSLHGEHRAACDEFDSEELCRVWRRILEAQADATERTLWVAWLDPEGARKPVVAGLEGVPPHPDAAEVAQVREFLGHLSHVAPPYLLYSRPGVPHVTRSDRAWAGAIRELNRVGGVERPILRAVGTSVSVLE